MSPGVRLDSSFHLFRRNVLNPAGKPPLVTAGILHTGGAISVKRGFGLSKGCAARLDCATVRRIRIFDVHVQACWHWLARTIANLDDRVTNSDGCMHYGTIRTFECLTDFFGAKCLSDKVEQASCALYDKIRIDRVEAFGPEMRLLFHESSSKFFEIRKPARPEHGFLWNTVLEGGSQSMWSRVAVIFDSWASNRCAFDLDY